MKKPKIKLDKAKLQQFFVQHTEKIVFAVMVFVLLKMLWGAYGRELYQKTAQELQQTADRARTALQTASWTAEIEKQQFPDAIASYVELAKTKPIQPSDYQIEPPLFASVLPTSSKRSKPEILAVTDLEVHADYGPFAIAIGGEAEGKEGEKEQIDALRGGGRSNAAQGYMWVVVTGLVPHERQVAEFSKRFKNAATAGKNEDRPLYKGYFIERAEVRTGNESDDELKWVGYARGKADLGYHNVAEQKKFRERWAGGGQEVILGEVIPEIAYPLGPLTGRDWGNHVGHSKLSSALVQEAVVEENEAEEPAEEDPQPGDADPFGNADEKAAGNRPQRERPGNIRIPGLPAEGAQRRRTVDPKTAQEADRYRLFRYFDFHVEEGKRYRYRIRLGVENPNYQVDPRFLEDAQAAKSPFLFSAWSEPSPVVTVPRANNLLAGTAKNVGGEIGARVLVRQFNKLSGDDAWAEQDMIRGQLANFDNVQVNVTKATGGTELGKSSLKTDTLVVDVAAEPMIQVQGKRKYRPTKLVLLGPDGQLVVRTESDDRSDYSDRLASAAAKEEPAPTGNQLFGEPDKKDPKKDRGLGRDELR